MAFLKRAYFLNVLKAIYSEVASQIISPYGSTHPVHLFRGLRQGYILSPLLFILLINDIKEYLEKTQGHEMFLGNTSISHLLFADDLVIFSQTPIGLQRFLNTLDKYCSKFHLTINLSKTYVVVFGNLEIPKVLKVKLEVQMVSLVLTYDKYLRR